MKKILRPGQNISKECIQGMDSISSQSVKSSHSHPGILLLLWYSLPPDRQTSLPLPELLVEVFPCLPLFLEEKRQAKKKTEVVELEEEQVAKATVRKKNRSIF